MNVSGDVFETARPNRSSAGDARAPVIETQRLRLRAHRADDWAACAAMWAEPEMTRHIGGTPSTREETWGRMLRYAGLWSMLGYGYWAIEERATHRFAGELGFADFKRELEPTIAGCAEIGWAIAVPYQQKGYATEAVRAALMWSDANIEHARTVCLIAAGNHASIRLAIATGFYEFARTSYKRQPTILFGRNRVDQETVATRP